ncbi:1814_t:CDS:2, partial [Diversispora eburnea]
HIDNIEIINNVQQSVEKGEQRNITNILKYLIPILIEKKILDTKNLEIHLRISGDDRNVGRKINHVIVTFSLLNNIEHIFHPENHYTILLYPGIEKYEILYNTLEQITLELRMLKDKGLKDNQGINSANSKHFCPWCEISKEQQDVLWRLVIDELKSRNTWDDQARNIIIDEIKHKLIVLQNFNLFKLFPNLRATQIKNLWNNFYLLYKAIKNLKTDASQFTKDACTWLHQFLNLNYPNSISSNHFYQAAFSCSAVEKKNHQQVSHFFKKTTKDGGVGKEKKFKILDILEYENRQLYFSNNNELDLVHASK